MNETWAIAIGVTVGVATFLVILFSTIPALRKWFKKWWYDWEDTVKAMSLIALAIGGVATVGILATAHQRASEASVEDHIRVKHIVQIYPALAEKLKEYQEDDVLSNGEVTELKELYSTHMKQEALKGLIE